MLNLNQVKGVLNGTFDAAVHVAPGVYNGASHQVSSTGSRIGDVFERFFTSKISSAEAARAAEASKAEAAELAKHLTINGDDATKIAQEILAGRNAATTSHVQGNFNAQLYNQAHGGDYGLPHAASTTSVGGGWIDNLFGSVGNIFGGGHTNSLEALYKQKADLEIANVLAAHQASKSAKDVRSAASLATSLGKRKDLYDNPHLLAAYAEALQTKSMGPMYTMQQKIAELQSKMLGSQIGLQTNMFENILNARVKAVEEMTKAFSSIKI